MFRRLRQSFLSRGKPGNRFSHLLILVTRDSHEEGSQTGKVGDLKLAVLLPVLKLSRPNNILNIIVVRRRRRNRQTTLYQDHDAGRIILRDLSCNLCNDSRFPRITNRLFQDTLLSLSHRQMRHERDDIMRHVF